MNAANDNTAPRGLRGWWFTPPRPGLHRLINPVEYRHLRAFGVTHIAAGSVAGAAGVILGIAFNSVSYIMGEPIMLQAFVVIVLGGLGSVPGALVAGVMLGVIQTLTTVYVSSELSDAVVFAHARRWIGDGAPR